jgi:YTV protein
MTDKQKLSLSKQNESAKPLTMPIIGIALLICAAIVCSTVQAQVWSPESACISCGEGQSYRLVYQTVYDQKQVTEYRVDYETKCDPVQVTSYKPVWETSVKTRKYTVARPVNETSYRDETYTVQKPIWETRYRDESYDKVSYVQETAMKEQRCTVWKQVCETQQRDEWYTVQKPVKQLSYQTQNYTVMRPVTTSATQYVDQGCYANQMVQKPTLFRYRLKWESAKTGINPTTGQAVYQRPGLYWASNQSYEVQKVWMPNVVAQQVPQTTYVPQTVQRQIPIETTTYQTERVCRKVPIQVTRMVPEVQVRKVPYTVNKPVRQRIERKVPYQVCRWETEQRVRRIPVTTCKTVYEQKEEQFPVRVCRMKPVVETVYKQYTVERRTPVTYTCNVPRVVVCRVPLDPCGNPIVTETTEAQNGPVTTREEPTPAPPQQKTTADPANTKPTLPAK